MKKAKTNLKNLIVDLIMLICPVLFFIFMAQSYVSGTLDLGLLGSSSGSLANGYQLIDFNGDGASDFNAVCLILACIFAGLLIVFAMLSILRDINIIKTKNYDKLLNALKLVLIIVLLLTTIASLITVCTQYSVSGSVTDSNMGAGWAVIVNMILSFVLVFTYLVSLIGHVRKKK